MLQNVFEEEALRKTHVYERFCVSNEMRCHMKTNQHLIDLPQLAMMKILKSLQQCIQTFKI